MSEPKSIEARFIELESAVQAHRLSVKALIEVCTKHTEGLQQQADSLRHLANDAAGNATWRASVEDVLGQHRAALKDLEAAFRKLAGPAAPKPAVN